MNEIQTRIAAGLERAFATHGFSAPNVDRLREAAQVSLRTLYRYYPSRDDMVLAALEFRHERYMSRIFSDLPALSQDALCEVIRRIGHWMESEAAHGCLFHSAVAAAPENPALKQLLRRHKLEFARRLAGAAGLPGYETELLLICEGLMQSWPICGDKACDSAMRLAAALLVHADGTARGNADTGGNGTVVRQPTERITP
ncbi:TetR/AcrR family transcriptional regulator [Labrenzia sp. 011]|uniref:TetR/AcrR family transcriptional regulator n=1 Tax=Labrenzia sp. 011 TaxID=2171494 RepID=UPI000D517919|nr:TetR/AcrR family transcriptional regulator [Labrenzia sp. 011]PVB62430.1 TetR family transcriptional regulator [Labrenzia sp. 011]